MNQSFFTPINEPYHHQHYNYYSPAALTINGQKSKKGSIPSATSSTNNNNNNNNNNQQINNQNTLPSLVKTTSALLSDHQQNNTNLYNNHHNNGNYNEAPSPSVHHLHQDNHILPPLSSLLPPIVDKIHSTTKYSSNTNYPHALNNSMSYATPQNVSPFNSPRTHDVYPPMSSPVSNTSRSTTEPQRRNSVASSATTCLSALDTPENQKRNFQTMISRIIAKEDKKVVKINQQQQTNLLMKVLKFNQLKLAQMIAQSNKSHHTISAQLLDNGRKLDVYVLARKKHIGVNSFSNTERRVDCFRLEDFSFNIVVLEPNH